MYELQNLECALREGRISRRDFVKRASALGLAAALPGSLLSGVARAAEPKKGGQFRVGMAGGSTSDTFDPSTITDLFMQCWNQGTVRGTLVEINANSQPQPDLAESWEASSDAAQWTVKLRKGVEFHNGKTMTADDVIASYNYHRGADSKSAAKGIVDPIKDIRKDGDNVVVFELSGGNADFPFILGDYHLTIQPAASAANNFTDGIGTGPYVAKEFQPGVRATATRNPNDYRTDRGWFDEIVFLSISDPNARTTALQTGQVDAISKVDFKTFDLLKQVPDVRTIEVTGNQHFTMAMLTDKQPFTDNNVRLALKYAVDREALVKTILRGHGRVGNDIPLGPANRYLDTDLPQREYDPDKAKHYLKRAGLDKLAVKLSAADAAFQGAVDAAVLYQNDAKAGAISIDVVREPNDGYWDNVWMKKPFCMVFWGGRLTADWMFSTAYAADAAWNDSHWKNKRFNELLVKARAELDDAKRREMYSEMQKLVRDDGGVIIPMFANYLAATSKKVMTPEKVSAVWQMDGYYAAQRWWFA